MLCRFQQPFERRLIVLVLIIFIIEKTCGFTVSQQRAASNEHNKFQPTPNLGRYSNHKPISIRKMLVFRLIFFFGRCFFFQCRSIIFVRFFKRYMKFRVIIVNFVHFFFS